ncbi:Developmentally regulated MAPK interacting protein, partial [Candidatus Magnetomorum sp. HK-1]
VSTALSQILYYWQYPRKINFNYEIKYYLRKNDKSIIERTLDNYARDTLNSMLSSIDYNESNVDEIAALCFAVGLKTKMVYYSDGSNTTAYDALNAMKLFEYDNQIEVIKFAALGVSNALNRIKDNMRSKLPVFLLLKKPKSGHAVIIDGYKTSNSMESFHINLGWGNNKTTWYNFSNNVKVLNYEMKGAIIDIVGKRYKVLYPNGGDELRSGQVVSIRWSSEGNPSRYVSIYLLSKEEKKSYTLKSKIYNNGTYSWQVRLPDNTESGSKYFILVKDYYDNKAYDISDSSFIIENENSSSCSIGEIQDCDNKCVNKNRTINWNSDG